MARISVQFKDGGTVTILLRSNLTPTVERLMASVPLSSEASIWGDEIYFPAPFHADLEADASADMEIGDVAFWPDGDAIAIFFGRTPASVDDRPRAYSPCNLIGSLEGDISASRRFKPGSALDVSHLR